MNMFKCCYGVSSRCPNYEHIPMYDFDGISLTTVETFIKHLQQKYGLDEFYIIQSTNGYNTVCLNKTAFGLIHQFGNSVLSPADRKHLELGNKRGYYVIRFADDKKLIKILRNNSNKYDKSLAHALFLEWFFNIDIKKTKKYDDNEGLVLVQYSSKKHGYHVQTKANYIQDLKKELPKYNIIPRRRKGNAI